MAVGTFASICTEWPGGDGGDDDADNDDHGGDDDAHDDDEDDQEHENGEDLRGPGYRPSARTAVSISASSFGISASSSGIAGCAPPLSTPMFTSPTASSSGIAGCAPPLRFDEATMAHRTMARSRVTA